MNTASLLSWQENAACRAPGVDRELFFAPDAERQGARDRREAGARAVCAACPVRTDCLEYRLGSPRQLDGGIWGGLDEDQRQAERRRRLRAARKAAAA